VSSSVSVPVRLSVNVVYASTVTAHPQAKVVYAKKYTGAMKKDEHQKYYNDKGVKDVTLKEVNFAQYRRDTWSFRFWYIVTVSNIARYLTPLTDCPENESLMFDV
jgi:hypothetical protein